METNSKKAWLYLLPAILFLGAFMVYPLIDVLIYSFEEGYNSASGTYLGVGAINYKYVLHDPYFLQALKNTFILVAITVPASTILALVISATCLFACSPGAKEENDGREKIEYTEGDFKMIATVTALDEKISVDVIEAEYASGIHWVIISDATAIVDGEGYGLTREDLKIGDRVEISYNGQIMMSYPPQIAAISIKKI